MPELNLDDVRLKDADELNDDEKKFLDEHQDELTDEERDAFGIEVKEPEPEPEPEPKPEPFAFKSKEEFDTAVEERTKAAIEADRRARLEEEARKKREVGEPEKIFEKAPADWEEAGQRIVEFQERRTETRDRVVRERIAAINREYDEQIVEIRRQNPNLPAKGTEEGEEFERELAEIGARFKGVTNMTEAYEVYEAKAGGAEKIGTKQKGVAGKVGKPSGGAPPLTKREYKKVAGRTLDEAEEAAVRKFRQLK